MIHIIDHKKVDLTNDEYQMYQDICKSYTSPTMNGEELFYDLFESNDEGTIVYLKPPSQRQTSMEVFLFLMIIMQQQSLRDMYKNVGKLCDKLQAKINEADQLINKLSGK